MRPVGMAAKSVGDAVEKETPEPVAEAEDPPPDAERRALLEEMIGAAKSETGPDAAHSQDFLYDDQGLPG